MKKRTAWISFPGAPYTQESACRAAKNTLGKAGWNILEGREGQDEAPDSCQLYFADYDILPFERLHPGVYDWSGSDGERDSASTLFPQLSCYSIRKSLIRKNYLANSLHLAQLKRTSIQQEGVKRIPLNVNGVEDSIAPRTWVFEATCADDLDELLTDDLYDLREELEENEDRTVEEKKWYILKPAMADRGMGIRLLDSVETLKEIFEEFEESDEEEEEEECEEDGRDQQSQANRTSIVTSQLRHFVIQEYLSQPLLVQPEGLTGMHKFHIRAYVLAQGSLRVFLYDDMLALFAPVPYRQPDGSADLSSHLTNTCLQGGAEEGAGEEEAAAAAATVYLLSDLVGCSFTNPIEGQTGSSILTEEMISTIRLQAGSVVAETFQACANAGRVHFQPWPYAWEIFGVDLLVEAQGGGSVKTWLLEVNAQPDFARTGDDLQITIDRLFERVLEITALTSEKEEKEADWDAGKSRDGMTLCLELPLSAGGW
ncbi:hypothetical protein CBS101457_006549 [Exobasidium rhododendri]|nr:hypothetical protein CBS101457_006549 [Exobasidium rhododendri]